MIVVDSNVVAYLYIHGEHSSSSVQAFERDSEWVAPPLWRSELRSVLVQYIRQGRLSLDQAQSTMRAAEGLLDGHEHQPSSDRVLSLAAASGCTAYDCEFVAAAQELDVPLVTVDRQLLASFPQVAISLAAFAAP